MNPLPKKANAKTGTTQRLVVTPGGVGGTAVSFHTHPGAAITGDHEVLIPERIAAAAQHVADLDAMQETGWWTADGATANMPAATFFVGMTVKESTLEQGFFSQVAFELDHPSRVFVRSALFGAWQAWTEVGAGAGVADLDDLGDVAISSPATGQVLAYNGTSWVNASDLTLPGHFTAAGTGWVDLTLATGFGNLTAFDWQKPQYRREGNKVWLRGPVNRTGALTAANVPLLTLPSGVRVGGGVAGSDSNLIFNQRSSVGQAEVHVLNSGNVQNVATMATNVWTSLDGIWFFTD